MDTFLGGAAVTLLVLGAFWVGLRLTRGRRPARSVEISSSIEQLRSIGQLSAYRVRIQEIVTETDHSWGDFGKRYLHWVLSSKKMAMIFRFDIDFVYDLKGPEFRIEATGPGRWKLSMPPCDYDVRIRDIRFYDEQAAKFLPWLLPDLLNGFLGDRFSVEAKNRLVDSARSHAEAQATRLIEDVQSEVQASAEGTLRSISRAFGAVNVEFEFHPRVPVTVEVGLPEELMVS